MSYSHRWRTERLISVARILLAAFSLLALRLDPSEPTRDAGIAYVLLAAYFAFALLTAVVLSRVTFRSDLFRVATHVIDLAVFAVLIYLTEGPTSPFFVFMVFALVTATLRWQWRGLVWTTTVVLVAYLGLGVYSANVLHDPAFAVDVFTIRSAYLVVIAGLLAFLGSQEARLREEVSRMALWSRDMAPDRGDGADYDRALGHAAGVMHVRRVLFALEEEEEPWLQLRYWDRGQVTSTRAALDEFAPLVAQELREAGFLCSKGGSGSSATCLYGSEQPLRRFRGQAVNHALAVRFDIGTVVSAPVRIGEGAGEAEGRLFFLGKTRLSSDDLTLADIVARRVADHVAETRLLSRVRESAAFEERVRLARDLHDGVLQSLTGTALRLETARLLLDRDLAAAGEVIESVQTSLFQEQRDLRLFVDKLKPEHVSAYRFARELGTRLRELKESVSRQWGVKVDVLLEDQGGPSSLEEDLADDISLIVHEGMVNSARHSGAARVRGTVRLADDSVAILLEDDGGGFDFSGRQEMASLRRLGVGPLALMQRVEARGGTLMVDSSPSGSRIEIMLPRSRATSGSLETA